MSAQKYLYVITKAPYSNATGIEALDAILIGASFELDVSVLFLHDGVFQLKANQNCALSDSSLPAIKQFTKTYKALEDFGVDELYVQEQSLAARGLGESDLLAPVKLVNNQSIKALIAEQDQVFTF